MAVIVAGFEWDQGNWPKCGKHGVGQAEIEFVLSRAPMIVPDRTGGGQETRFNAIGRNADGRHLFLVFTIRGTDVKRIRPISARYMHAHEVDHYERQRS